MKSVEAFLNNWHSWSRHVPLLMRSRAGGRFGLGSMNRLLGAPPDARLLIVNLDDAGLCRSHNLAVERALEGGLATSCTLMTVTPGFAEFATLARANPRWSVGVHLTLTSEWPRLHWGPLLDRRRVPSLSNRRGWFYPTLWEAITRCRPGDVDREWRAQVRRALDAGVNVDHIDCHMGPYHFRPAFFRVARRIARDYRLAMRVVLPWRQAPTRALGVPCIDYAVVIPHRRGGRRLWRTALDRRRQVSAVLAGLRPGLSCWWTHISLDDAEWRAIRPPDEDLDQEDYPGEHRDQYEERITDGALLADPDFRREIEAMGIRLVTYRDLRDAAWAPAAR
ncbi:MAG: ChbG/HpnK family deacetylase [Planctomycetes bacterium]|nr:ChbG/HpnK family deacetylase [Planctomycetota bacterium]